MSFDLNKYLQAIENIIANPEEEGLPACAPIVAMYMKDYKPQLPPKSTPYNMSSAKIASDLEDVWMMTASEVSAVMVKLGFRLWCDEVRGLEWAIVEI